MSWAPETSKVSTLTWPVCDMTHRRRYVRRDAPRFSFQYETGVSHIRAAVDVSLWDIRGNADGHIGSLALEAISFSRRGGNDVSMGRFVESRDWYPCRELCSTAAGFTASYKNEIKTTWSTADGFLLDICTNHSWEVNWLSLCRCSS